ncbi:hypothetical protein WG66_000481 [Moniliophthora roreri]|uniref:Uncharacterized protein n=1 Tax=Moniliophthora roreri TaxID=221103 RepID=A0A0W0F0Y8_MONRR|nr:hypothetical protein WG66_000481 [Moniliophthora roreri]
MPPPGAVRKEFTGYPLFHADSSLLASSLASITPVTFHTGREDQDDSGGSFPSTRPFETSKGTAPTLIPICFNPGQDKTETTAKKTTCASALITEHDFMTGSKVTLSAATQSMIRVRTAEPVSSVTSSVSAQNFPVAPIVIGSIGGVLSLLLISFVLRYRRRLFPRDRHPHPSADVQPFSTRRGDILIDTTSVIINQARPSSTVQNNRTSSTYLGAGISQSLSVHAPTGHTWVTFGSGSDQTEEALPNYWEGEPLPSYQSTNLMVTR